MNSKVIQKAIVLAALGLLSSQDTATVNALNINSNHQVDANAHNRGIFGKMIEQVMAPQMLADQKKKASERKRQQLEEAQREYDKNVAEEEAEELAKKKKEEEAAEAAALEAAKNSPQARMLAAANDAATNINMSEMEATIQAQLQAKLNSGMSKSELLASAGSEELMSSASAAQVSAPVFAAPVATVAPIALQQTSAASSVVASVLAKHKAAAQTAPVIPKATPKIALAATPAPVVAKPLVKAAPAIPVQSAAQVSAEAKASQEKVKEMASKLGVPFTTDLMALGSNSAISDALIEKAVAAGKSETEINAAMASL